MDWHSICRSARSTRPTSRPTAKRGSAAGPTRNSSAPCARGWARADIFTPAMPYASYTFMSRRRRAGDQGLSRHAARSQLPDAALTFSFPYNQRSLMTIWSALFNPNRRFQPNADRSPAWNRGAYLAEGMGHCGECHTPRNLMQALDNRKNMPERWPAGWLAFNITSDQTSGVGAWSDAELAQYLSQGHAPWTRHGHRTDGRSRRSQPEASDTIRHRGDGDLSSFGSCHLDPRSTQTPWSVPRRPRTARRRGRRLAARQEDLRGSLHRLPCLEWQGVAHYPGDAQRRGAPSTILPQPTSPRVVIWGATRHTEHGQSIMPAFGNAYSDAEIAAVANYITAPALARSLQTLRPSRWLRCARRASHPGQKRADERNPRTSAFRGVASNISGSPSSAPAGCRISCRFGCT